MPTLEQLDAHLQEQLGFLRSSALAYDAGRRDEAKRLAVTIRVLVHETSRSHSLLGQLDALDKLRFFDTLLRGENGELSPGTGSQFDTGGLAMPSMGAYPDVDWVPYCYHAPVDYTSDFDTWWKGEVFATPDSGPVTRRNVVLWLANKDGGAHIDDLPPAYAGLLTGGGVMVGTRPGPPARPAQSPIPAIVRQIAEELGASILAVARPGPRPAEPPA